jgi:hypothetical protein
LTPRLKKGYHGSQFATLRANVPAFINTDVQPKSSIPIGAKVEIGLKGFTLGVKAEITFISKLGPTKSQKCSKLAPSVLGLDSYVKRALSCELPLWPEIPLEILLVWP